MLEELPFDNHGFDVVTGFNSFQYAGNPAVALARPGGCPARQRRGHRDLGDPDAMELISPSTGGRR